MKKFQFSLGKLLDYKDQVLDKEKNELAVLNGQRAQAYSDKEALQRKLKEAQDDFNRQAAKGMSAMQMTLFTGYHKSLRMQIEDAERAIVEIEKSVEKQTKVVTEASKDVNSLEKLREKQLSDYNFQAAKAEELFIEEYVSSSAIRAAQQQ